jgi:Tol biopolymer transport system component
MLKQLLRRLFRTQHAQLTVIDIDGNHRSVVHQTRARIEAPHWTPDGQWLIFNGGGRLFRLPSDGSGVAEQIPTGTIDQIGNDHLLSPNGQTLFFTAGGRIYAVGLTGGQPEQVSPAHEEEDVVYYYVHGISPDGAHLSCAGVAVSAGKQVTAPALYVVEVATRAASRLTHVHVPVDGAEFSPDGQWIYFNGELHAKRPGHSLLYRMRGDGSGIEQLTQDERVNWFAHVSPDGSQLVYLSYAPGTLGHPADRAVLLRRMPAAGGQTTDVVALFGGQGTLNANSWSPDGKRVAYVAYPWL